MKPARRRAPIHELVYQEIRRSLMVGMFAPGEKVSLRSLAQRLGTSLTPVRAAVNRLIAEGAFEVLPNRWIVIPLMTEEKFNEIIDWRAQLEMAATRKAAKHVTPNLLKKLAQISKNMVDSFNESDNRVNLLLHNHQFHFTIYEASRSTILMPMIESLWLQAGPFTYYSMLSPRDLWDAKFHEEVIQALRNRDPETAAEAIRNDIVNTAEFLRKHGQYEQPKLRKIVP